MRQRFACGLLALIFVTPSAVAQAPESRPLQLPPQKRMPLERIALDLARKGRLDDAILVLDVLTAVGHEPAATEIATKTSRETAAKVGKRLPVDPALLRALKDAVKALNLALKEASEQDRPRLAALVLRLDESEDARSALGHVKDADGRWTTAISADLLKRRGHIRDLLAKARKLEVEVTIAPSEHPLLVAVEGRPGITASVATGFGSIDVHTIWPEAKIVRVMRESMRLYAFSRAVIRGDLGYDDAAAATYVHFESDPKYKQALEISRTKGWIDAKEYKFSKDLSAFDGSAEGERFRAVNKNREAEFETSVFLSFCFQSRDVGDAQPCLLLGHANWASLTYLGEAMPGIAYVEETGGGGRRTGRSELDAEREFMLRMAQGGIAGARTYLAWLAAGREDPAWSHSMVDEVGKIEGLDKLKSTFVAEYLHELGTFAEIAEKSKPRSKSEATDGENAESGEDKTTSSAQSRPNGPVALITAALGMSLGAFEDVWRAWIVPPSAPLYVRLSAAPVAVPKDAAAALAHLQEIRKLAFDNVGSFRQSDGKVRKASTRFAEDSLLLTLDLALSDGCRKHARYLAKHVDQAAAWPDAHEEWPDRELFSPEGANAAGNGVIAPGSSSPEGAVDSWMATYYHRLPLIDSGLMRIGFGLDRGVAVLDCGSFVAPVVGEGHVVWPYDGMKNVPLSFAPELPHPVPGQDESQFGYPVTLQTAGPYPGETFTEPELALFEGVDEKSPLPAHVSTPSNPTNPVIAPKNAYCLMTKARFKPKTHYTATARWPDGRTLVWRFTTGGK